jgi:hypothetical protein
LGLADVQALDGLAGDVGDDLEVFVQVPDGQPRELGGCRDDEIRDRGRAVLATVGQQGQDLDG